MGKQVVALLTDMDQPLGRAIGNALEVIEAVEMLRGRAPDDYTEITLALSRRDAAGRQGGGPVERARAKLHGAMKSGGREEARSSPRRAAIRRRSPTCPGSAREEGDAGARDARWLVTAIDLRGAQACGDGARWAREVERRHHPAVGFMLEKKVGDQVKTGEPFCRCTSTMTRVKEVTERVLAAYTVGPAAPGKRPLVLERFLS